MIHHWREQPHVRAWWGDPDEDRAEDKLDDPRIAMRIVSHQGRPFAFAQDYDVHGWTHHPFAYLPPGSRGIDQFIGEPDMLNRGHGSAFVREHVASLFASKAPADGTDPHPDNQAARRAYEKADFVVTRGPLDTLWGRALLMERWLSASADMP